MIVSFRKWILTVPVALMMGGGSMVLGDPPSDGLMSSEVGPASCSSDGGKCKFACKSLFCGPFYKHCAERPPKLWFRQGCPKPVCPPNCDTPNWGYYQPCWNPFPWPPDWSHCPVQPPASVVYPGHEVIIPTRPEGGPSVLPPPRKTQL